MANQIINSGFSSNALSARHARITWLRAGDAMLTMLCVGMTIFEVFHNGREVLILVWALSGVFCLASFWWSWGDSLVVRSRSLLMALGVRSALR